MKQTNSIAAIYTPSLLTVAFIVLKLCKVINWSWWWVLSPTLIELGLILIVAIVTAIVYLHTHK